MIAPHYQDDSVTLHHGDCIDVLRELPERSVDAVVTDPPYGIRFMGKAWDGADIEERTARGRETNPMPKGVGGPQGGYRSRAAEAGRYDLSANAAFGEWCSAWATECLRILKPGGHLLAFGGSRTWHRLSSGIEDAGFEIRDSIAWLYGSGFPKSMDVSKAIDKAAGVGQAKRTGKESGTYGAFTGNNTITAPVTADAKQWQGWGTALKPAFEPIVVARKPLAGTVAANVLEHGTGALNINACRIHTAGSEARSYTVKRLKPGAELNRTGGNWRPADGVEYEGTTTDGRWPTNVVLDAHQAEVLDQQSGLLKSGARTGKRSSGTCEAPREASQGGASRFFPVFRYEAKAPTSERPSADGVQHPTVKPLDLMRWLVRLVTPVGAVVLEPFAGSGTTAEACILEDRRCIAIEREAEYLPLIVSRLRKPVQQGLFGLGAGA
ncbi:DNA-methyltransferase [Mycobacteroides abscessus]|uniref:DNA-methyltransferase n=2 Tax=Mycobacteroides abscessus TaxID=36809 RepID=UPI0009A6A547|nr:site-specific DNA-methyltransferase [Mycobacteroides abscessus]SKT95980.1 DNA methylase N-4/N-6 [Mycobacteroides abscessus subsp. massiliense]